MMTLLCKLVRSIADNVNIWIERKIAQVVSLVPMETSSPPHQSYSYTKKIRVKRASECFYWYKHHIGEVFDVESESPDYYWVREWYDYYSLVGILKKDAEVI